MTAHPQAPARRSARQYTRKSPAHGVGIEALCAAVINAAVRDAVGVDDPEEDPISMGKSKYDAMRFLRSEWCQSMLDFLNLPDRTALITRIRKGLPPEVITDLGSAADIEAPRKKAKINLAVQPMLFVL
jgi:hypothetical protein